MRLERNDSFFPVTMRCSVHYGGAFAKGVLGTPEMKKHNGVELD